MCSHRGESIQKKINLVMQVSWYLKEFKSYEGGKTKSDRGCQSLPVKGMKEAADGWGGMQLASSEEQLPWKHQYKIDRGATLWRCQSRRIDEAQGFWHHSEIYIVHSLICGRFTEVCTGYVAVIYVFWGKYMWMYQWLSLCLAQDVAVVLLYGVWCCSVSNYAGAAIPGPHFALRGHPSTWTGRCVYLPCCM